MYIFRRIRITMVRLITRATCHCEVRATCFPEGGVPTLVTLPNSLSKSLFQVYITPGLLLDIFKKKAIFYWIPLSASKRSKRVKALV